MTRFVLVPGAGGAPSYWSRVLPGLVARGHEAVAVDLPGPDPDAGLPQYRDAVLAALRGDDVVVAQSLGAFPAVMACAQHPVAELVLVNAMIPAPGETPGQWWGNTGSEAARRAAARAGGYPEEFDLATYFLHDVPPEVLGEDRDEADIAFGQPCAVDAWPAVPTRVIAGAHDRFFPVDFQRRLARERLGLAAEVVPGGHLNALSRPDELIELLLADHAIGLPAAGRPPG
ncbi:alpha/beta fold hydrolase [Actinokineospora sp. NPDC004072]